MPMGNAFWLAAWWVSPLIVYLSFCRTNLGAISIGLGFIGSAGLGLFDLYTSDSSTAALGLFAIPVLLWAGMIVAVLIELAISRRRIPR